MKAIVSCFLLLISSLSFAGEKIKLNGKMYVPEGFDDNDQIEVTVVGTLPNSCYRNPSFEVDSKDGNFKVRLYAEYYELKEGCRDIQLAYVDTIKFGTMNAGEYKIQLINKKATDERKLVIKTASSELVDDFLYGNVSGVAEDDDTRTVELVGMNPVSCLKFSHMATEIQKAMIIIRPHFVEEGSCVKKPTPFKIKYEVPFLEGHPKGILLHVRVMNGRSFNYLYHNRF